MNELGTMLRRLRNEAGLSLKEVYKLTEISDSKLNRIENGSNASETGPGILKSLAKIYNVNLVELYLVAGYLDDEALSSYQRTFHDVDLLTDDEKQHIQKQIDLFTKGRTRS